jgi:hypothetical protein
MADGFSWVRVQLLNKVVKEAKKAKGALTWDAYITKLIKADLTNGTTVNDSTGKLDSIQKLLAEKPVTTIAVGPADPPYVVLDLRSPTQPEGFTEFEALLHELDEPVSPARVQSPQAGELALSAPQNPPSPPEAA